MFRPAVLILLPSMIEPSLAYSHGDQKIATLPEGFKCEISSKDSDTLQFKVELPISAWFAIGYGQGMSNINMVMFSENGVKDLWSKYNGMGFTITDAEENNYVDTVKAVDNGVVTITTFRSRETGDSAQHF